MLVVRFIVGHYAVMWFHIKWNWTCQNGSKNVHKSVMLLSKLHPDLARFVKPVIQRNGYGAHSKALLLAMLMESACRPWESGVCGAASSAQGGHTRASPPVPSAHHPVGAGRLTAQSHR